MEPTVDVHLHRQCVIDSWGFSMAGGIEQHRPLTVTKVFRSTPAEGKLEEGEMIVKINERPTNKFFHREAVNLIQRSGPYLKLTISRAHMRGYGPFAPQQLNLQPELTTESIPARPTTPQGRGVFRGATGPPSSLTTRALTGFRPPPSFFYSTPDVALAGTPAAATRPVEVNLARHKPLAAAKPRDFNTAAKSFYREGDSFGARMFVKF